MFACLLVAANETIASTAAARDAALSDIADLRNAAATAEGRQSAAVAEIAALQARAAGCLPYITSSYVVP